MTITEACCLTEEYESVYQCYHELAKYFQTTCTEDKWISDHFFELALEVTGRLKESESRLMAEAHCNMGLALKENGKLSSHFSMDHVLCFCFLFHNISADSVGPHWPTDFAMWGGP